MNHIIGIFNIVKVLQGQGKKKEAVTKTKPTGHPELREHKEGRQSQSPETMHCTSQVQVLAINVAKNIFALCLLLSERWATYLAS